VRPPAFQTMAVTCGCAGSWVWMRRAVSTPAMASASTGGVVAAVAGAASAPARMSREASVGLRRMASFGVGIAPDYAGATPAPANARRPAPGGTERKTPRDRVAGSVQQLGFQGDRHGRQRLGYRAVLLGVIGDGAELGGIDARHLGLQLEPDLRQARAAFHRQVHVGTGLQRIGREPGLAQLGR